VIPLTILCSLLAIGLAASLTLFFSIQREVRAQAMKNRGESEFSRTAPAAPEPVYISPAPRSGMNISTRVQAMRMVRRNEDVSHIAAALGITRREVELLIRVQRIRPAGTG
jgi:hypothetical protein